jgi:hypothetical protein
MVEDKPFRVWVHPKRGDDYFYDFDSYEEAKAAVPIIEQRKGVAFVEDPLRFENGREYPANDVQNILGTTNFKKAFSNLGLGNL